MTRLDEIMRLAEEATPGPWWHGDIHHPDGHALAWIGKHFVDCEGGQKNYREQADDAAFIAALNPQTVSQMVELIWMLRQGCVTGEIAHCEEALAAYERFENGE